MSRTATKEVFQFDELNDRAKEKARDWYRDCAFDHDWYEYTYEDASKCAAILGIEIATKPVKLMGGGTRFDPAIWFQLSYSQGDGSAFDGVYRYAKQAEKKIRSHAPEDARLSQIARDLAEAQKIVNYRAVARIKSNRDTWIDVDFDWDFDHPKLGEVEKQITEALRDFNRWIYDRLREECDYQSADEQVDESIRANEYEFTEDGKRYCY